jgi:transcriptional regulator with XRE-family HTH domain
MMNQIMIGNFITLKRKEKNLTQEELAQKLGVSNKTISKWETGKCMPDYSIIESLCKELDITIQELITGEESKESNKDLNEKEIMDLIRKTQELEKHNKSLYGCFMVAMGFGLQALSHTIVGSNFKDFISGFLMGISIVVMLVGVYIIGRGLSKK